MDLRERDCPLCGPGARAQEFYPARMDERRLDAYAFASRKVPEFMHCRLLRCRDCDVLYASPAPSAETLSTEYERAAYDSGVEATFAADTYAHYLTKRVLPQLRHREGALDIGTGNGAFLRDLLANGFSGVTGIEPSTAPIAAAAPEIRALIRQGMFRAADFEDASLSLISCFQTIEHVYDPLALARDVFRLLRPGGAAYFVSHNYLSLQARLLRERSPIIDIEHLQLFSPPSVRRLLAKAGFERIVVFPIANRYPLAYWLRLLPLPNRAKANVGKLLRTVHADQVPIPLRAGNLATIGFRP